MSVDSAGFCYLIVDNQFNITFFASDFLYDRDIYNAQGTSGGLNKY